jgi:serine/threonine protein kinase
MKSKETRLAGEGWVSSIGPYDTSTKRDVALKTLRGTVEPQALELFAKEWTVLASLSRPNIVDILDSGEFEDEGQKKPFFVMPLLPGGHPRCLDSRSESAPDPARVVEIMTQTSKGCRPRTSTASCIAI